MKKKDKRRKHTPLTVEKIIFSDDEIKKTFDLALKSLNGIVMQVESIFSEADSCRKTSLLINVSQHVLSLTICAAASHALLREGIATNETDASVVFAAIDPAIFRQVLEWLTVASEVLETELKRRN